jgi:hypothetical protein
VSFHQYWFPWWELEVDSAAVPMGRDEALGTCAFDVSAGDHEVRITFEASPAHKAAACVSRILTALVLLMLSKHAISGLLPSRKTASPRGAST